MNYKYLFIFIAIAVIFTSYSLISTNNIVNKKLDIIINDPEISNSIDVHSNIINIASAKPNDNSKLPTYIILFNGANDSTVKIKNNIDNQGYLISSDAHKKIHLKISKDDFDESMRKGWHLADNGTITAITIDYVLNGNYYFFDVDLSTTCVGCSSGSYVESFTAQTNASVPTFSQSLTNITGMTANITDYATQADPYAINTTGLVGWWKFDNNLNDSSGNGYNGLWKGVAGNANYTTGKYNNATIYNGVNDYVDAGNGASLNITNAITVEAWVKIPTTTGSSNRGIVSKYEGVNPTNQRAYDLLIDWQTQNNVPKIRFIISANGSSAAFAGGNTTLSANIWYHVVGVYIPSTSISVYLNGDLDGTNTTSIPASIFVSSVSAKIGYQYTNDPLYFFNGSIDDVRIYNRALSAAEISAQRYTHLQQLQIKATGNGTASGNWNGTGSNPLTIPVASTDTITGMSYLIPSSAVINGITVYDYANTTKWNITATATFTQNSTVVAQNSANGYYTFNGSVNLSLLCSSNCYNNFTITDATMLAAMYHSSTASMITNDANATLSYTYPHLNISSTSIPASTNKNYNITIAYNNPPVASVSPQTFNDTQNVSVSFSATDPESNALTCSGTLGGVTINSCTSPHNFGIKASGTYLYSLNVTDNNGTLGGVATWSNTTGTITVLGTNIQISISAITGNFFINHSWTYSGNSTPDKYNVLVNSIWDNTSSATFRNNSYAPHGWQNISVCGYNQTTMVTGACSSQNTQIPNNIPVMPILNNKNIDSGNILNISATSTDLDSDTLTYSTNSTIGTFNTTTGNFTYHEQDSDVGIYPTLFQVCDPYVCVNQTSIITVQSATTLILAAINNQPTMVSSPGFDSDLGVVAIVGILFVLKWRKK